MPDMFSEKLSDIIAISVMDPMLKDLMTASRHLRVRLLQLNDGITYKSKLNLSQLYEPLKLTHG